MPQPIWETEKDWKAQKLSYEEFKKLSREEKRQAIINFTAPEDIYKPAERLDLKGEKI